MLKLVKFIDYDANYAYAPPEKEATINTEYIISAIPIAPENTRSSYSLVRLRFHDGSRMDVVGTPRDFIEIENAK